MSQLSLFSSSEPVALPSMPSIDDMAAWNAADRTMCAYDAAFPIEEVPCRRGKIFLRLVDGVWLWGIRYRNPKTGAGQCFRPFRKWGPKYAAETREEAIMAAREYRDRLWGKYE